MKRPKITRDTNRKELAAMVHASLRGAGIDSVLVGGSVVALYSKEQYVTDDLDFVSYRPLKIITPVMEGLGFKMVGNRALHPASNLSVQFCAPPLAVVREPVTPIELKTPHGPLVLLSATDCVLDRLMKYYHWNDEQGLEQALLVARHRKIDLGRVRALSKREGKHAQLEIFESRLRAQRSRT